MKLSYKKLYTYKYTLVRQFNINIPIYEPCSIDKYVDLDKHGNLIIYKGYSWDGCSGPTIDTKSSMVAGLVHDAIYQIMREGKLDRKYRKTADILFRKLCISNGMSRLRAWTWYIAIRLFSSKFVESDIIEV